MGRVPLNVRAMKPARGGKHSADRPSTIDALTGIFNRAHLTDLLTVELVSSMHGGSQGAVLFAEVGGLKQVNDRAGRFAGDQALCAVAAQMYRMLPAGDLVGRYRGNAFVLLARGSDVPAVARLAERLRGAIESLVMVAGRERVRMTISVGVAWLTELAPGVEAVPTLVALAEARMNEAKASGGNRVCTTSADAEPADRLFAGELCSEPIEARMVRAAGLRLRRGQPNR
jgi:diguanylate cyclase (GGDEF)-like protein